MTSSIKPTFKEAIIKTISFLGKEKVDYFLLGGVAVTLLAEPRFTKDLDLDLFLSKDAVPFFFEKIHKAKFALNKKEMIKRVKQTGTFRMLYGDVAIDIILASTELEKSALNRRQKITLYGEKTWLPSPEDLILLKIIPGRPQDLIDVGSLVLRHGKKLDKLYLEKWAQRISDEMQNFRVWHTLQGFFK